MLRAALILAVIGHILCGICDCLLGFTPRGRIDLKCIRDPGKMREEFEHMPLVYPLTSVVLGTFAILMFSFGYLALSIWMYRQSSVSGIIMLIAAMVFAVPIVAHHIICGFVEWFYVKMGRTNEAGEAVLTFQKQTISTMAVGYLGLLVFVVTLLVTIATGKTELPWWACFFNTLPFFLVMAPTKIPAKGNIAGALMFAVLLVLLW